MRKTTLGEIFEIARGGSPRPIDDYITDDPDGVNWIMIGDASIGSKCITKTKKRIKLAGVSRSRMVNPGDFLLTNSMSFGHPYILGTKGCIHDGWLVLSPREPNIDRDYFYHMLGSPAVYAQFVRRAAGATVKNLNIDIVRGVEVNLPSLGDQQRIAAILDQADSLRRLRQRAIDRLNSLGQAIFNEMFGEQAGNPKRWRTGELMDIVHDDDQINYGVVQPGVETESGVPLVRVADLLAPAIDIAALKKIDAEIESKYKRSRLRGDEVLVGCVGSIGAVTIAHRGMRGINIARAVGRIPVDPRKAHPQFIAEHLKTRSSQNYFRAETRTVAQPTLNIKQLKETPIMLPPLEKQEEFSHIASEVEKEKTSSSAYLESLNAFFSTLQHRAFRGEL